MMWIQFLLTFACAYALGWLGRWSRTSRNAEVNKSLALHGEYQKIRDKQYPEMINKWGKP